MSENEVSRTQVCRCATADARLVPFTCSDQPCRPIATQCWCNSRVQYLRPLTMHGPPGAALLNVRFTPDSDRRADIPEGLKGADFVAKRWPATDALCAQALEGHREAQNGSGASLDLHEIDAPRRSTSAPMGATVRLTSASRRMPFPRRFAPSICTTPDSWRRSKKLRSFDRFVGADQQQWRKLATERPSPVLQWFGNRGSGAYVEGARVPGSTRGTRRSETGSRFEEHLNQMTARIGRSRAGWPSSSAS
jgi:hypothetical protein